MMNTSQELFTAAQEVIPGGVNSPVRAFGSVGGTPVYIAKAKGAYLTSAEGKEYVDYVGSWGPMITGHADEDVLAAVRQQMELGLSYGAPTALETQMAEKITQLMPSIEKVRMVNSCTEATMSAIRLARGYTGRDKIIKFEGCYHGHSDSLLVKAGSGALTFGVPTSPGVPASLAEHTLTLSYNDIEQLKSCFAELGDQIACVIVEPVAGNMNCIPPVNNFLQALREECSKAGAVLIFDEVMTGFRVSLGGAQAHYGVTPDLTTLGKIVGGGLPVGAFGGKAEIMNHLSPLGPVYQAGTLSGNPLAMAAGLALLNKVSQPNFHQQLGDYAQKLCQGLEELAKAAGVPFTTQQVGAMFGLFFTEQQQITNFEQATQGNLEAYKVFFHAMLEEGVYLAPSAYEAGFVSSAHSEQELAATLAAAKKAFAKVAAA